MSRVCSVCGKGRMSGNQVSHSNRKTRRSWAPNVQKVKVKTSTGGTEEVPVKSLRKHLTTAGGLTHTIFINPSIAV